jgi:two-component system chemotaxis response regulator CheY
MSRPRILIVEDSCPEQMMAGHMVRLLGGDAVLANNGLDALDQCRMQMPDVVLLDWTMPGMDGPAVMTAIRELPDGHKPKIIFCTAEDTFAKIAHVMSNGADSFIIKPFSIDTLAHNLNYVGIVTTRQPSVICKAA